MMDNLEEKKTKKPILWMVIPCYNEEEVLVLTAPMFLKQLNVMIDAGQISEKSRILFVNDGSKDSTWDIIVRLSKEDEHYIGMSQSRNRGHQNAVLAGLMEAKDECDITISIDCDGQDDITKMIIKQAVDQLNNTSYTVEKLRSLMDETASKLPEYPVVMQMKGVGPSLGPQLIAEIGDITRFHKKSALTAFAGIDPGVNESGSYEQKSVPTTKRGSADLRKTLFQIMDVLIKTAPIDDPVYQFLDKKRSQGKPYYVYMTAGANKFLRVYY